MKNKFLKILLSFMILIQSMIFQVSSPDFILCIGDEGHFAVEISTNEHHSNVENHCSNTFFNKITSQHHFQNNDCIDISLDYHFDNSHIKRFQFSVNPIHYEKFISLNFLMDYSSDIYLSSETKSTSNKILSSIILLI